MAPEIDHAACKDVPRPVPSRGLQHSFGDADGMMPAGL
jgi:hypothetical protein